MKTLEESGISEEGNIGAVSLNLEKIKRWKRESKHAGYEGKITLRLVTVEL